MHESDERILGAMEALEAQRKAKQRRNLLWVAGVFVVVIPLMLLAFAFSDAGTATEQDGTPAVARIDRAADGNCTVGVKRSHCYRLHFTVYPDNEPPFPAQIDVNVEDRWASRIQPGSNVWVIRDKDDPKKVYLNVEAFSKPAPSARH